MTRKARIGALGLAGWLGSVAIAAAQPPPSDFDKVTAPMPPHGRRGKPPPPRLPDRLQPRDLPVDTAHDLGLVRQEDGTYLYLDPDRRYSARFRPDGRVHFADRWRRTSAKNARRGRCCGRPPEGVAASANPFWAAPVQGPLEWIMRGTGHDPNGSAKATLLAKTRAFRTRLAVSWHRELFAARLDELDDELAALWSDETMDLADKKQLLFARWDECAERFDVSTAGIPENASVRIDEARVDAALRARTTIEVFVRRHAPADSPQAYTNAELQRLNARRVSVRAFAPYAPKETS